MDSPNDSSLALHSQNQSLFSKHDSFAKVARFNWVSNHSYTLYLEHAVPANLWALVWSLSHHGRLPLSSWGNFSGFCYWETSVRAFSALQSSTLQRTGDRVLIPFFLKDIWPYISLIWRTRGILGRQISVNFLSSETCIATYLILA